MMRRLHCPEHKTLMEETEKDFYICPEPECAEFIRIPVVKAPAERKRTGYFFAGITERQKLIVKIATEIYLKMDLSIEDAVKHARELVDLSEDKNGSPDN